MSKKKLKDLSKRRFDVIYIIKEITVHNKRCFVKKVYKALQKLIYAS